MVRGLRALSRLTRLQLNLGKTAAMQDPPTEAPSAFLDTSTVKLAADHVIRGFQRHRTIQWGPRPITVPVVQYRSVPKVPRHGTDQFADAAVLPLIAFLATRGRLELLWHLDGIIEFAGLPNTDRPGGRFFGAPIRSVTPPAPFGRIIASGHRSMTEHQLDFLTSLREQRFLDLQVAVGVKRGSKHIANQMLDAWHIYCAEKAGATYFVTCDYKLIHHLESHRKTRPDVAVVTPRQLLEALGTSGQYGLVDRLAYRLAQLRGKLSPESRTGEEDLAALGEILERQGFYDQGSGARRP